MADRGGELGALDIRIHTEQQHVVDLLVVLRDARSRHTGELASFRTILQRFLRVHRDDLHRVIIGRQVGELSSVARARYASRW